MTVVTMSGVSVASIRPLISMHASGVKALVPRTACKIPMHAVSEQLRMLGGPRAAPALHHQANVVNAFLDDHLEARLAAHGAKPWCPRLKPGLCG